ncbi:MAG: helix-hairpin-helix domain-containing protein [Bacteroidia bacterium]|nr:helix-hairpin-helix domain-containing protein [Bacteroidia bacterium]
MSLRSVWKDYFTFNRKERNGAFLLLLICCLLIGWLTYFRFFYQPEKLKPDQKFLEEAAAFEAKLKAMTAASVNQDNRKAKREVAIELFYFNPNEINDSMAKSLGMPEYLSSRIINYVNKGGKFHMKKDLLKIYGMDSALYFRLEPYLTLPDSAPEIKKYASEHAAEKKSIKPLEVYDLNTCTYGQLTDISGIGDWRANKILNYRNRLGGFTSTEQLLETGAIDSAVFKQIKNQLKVSTPVFRKISLKNFQCRTVYHPYLKRELCREIEKKLFLSPHLKNLEELRSLPSMNDSLWQKLSPYLSIN